MRLVDVSPSPFKEVVKYLRISPEQYQNSIELVDGQSGERGLFVSCLHVPPGLVPRPNNLVHGSYN